MLPSCPSLSELRNNTVMYKQIRNFPNYYISTDGVVISITNPKKPKIMKQFQLSTGYMNIKLTMGTLCKNKKIHRLMCETWLPNHFGKKTVNHKDHDKTNNSLWNLQWATQKEQCVGLGKIKRTHLLHSKTDLVGEEWKLIEEFPNYYISNKGRTRRKKSDIRRYGTWRESDITPTWTSTFYIGKKQYSRRTHNIVAKYFLDNPNNYEFVKFVNGDRRNICVENLVWSATHK